VKPGCARPPVVPMYHELRQDIIMSNLQTAGATREDWLAWLAKR